MSDAISKAIEAMEFAKHAVGPFHRIAAKKLTESIDALQALQSGEPVGHARWLVPDVTLATFRADRVPAGTALYAAPQPVVPDRNDLIELLIATRTQSEGVTADLIIKLLTAGKEAV